MIPAAFAERFLWKAPCNLDDSPQPESDNIPSPSVQQPTFTFSPAVLAELDSVFSLAFVEAEKKQSKLLKLAMDAPNPGHTPPVGAEISIALSCPQYQGTPILDAAVKHIAEEYGAEVLVLDAFEIASGRFGVLGESGRVIVGTFRPGVLTDDRLIVHK
ncbi:hypothetical protein DFP72DRAFT_1169733 [Ephemerocybe angulata]|uniref:Uncharacterized protein n=1 Tax=Ephemerocybe angulata TaxID=980116 RepID=A0A8H6HY06_9AGAR|nr:hypothetical protein DFP72DRAFT_1169733 [Tulosesus angulatus]